MKTIRNSVRLVGNLGQDVSLKSFSSGTEKASFSLATSDYYINAQGEKVTSTQWHNIVAWGKTAELMASLLKKGDMVIVTGSLQYRTYVDQQGNTRNVTEVQANAFLKTNRSDAGADPADRHFASSPAPPKA